MAASSSTIFLASWPSTASADSLAFRFRSSCNVAFSEASRLFSMAFALNEYARIFFLHGAHKPTAPLVVLSNNQVSCPCVPQFAQVLFCCDLVAALSRIISSFCGAWLLLLCFFSFFRGNSIPHFGHRTISFLRAFLCAFSCASGDGFDAIMFVAFLFSDAVGMGFIGLCLTPEITRRPSGRSG
jgi:hypothetical protein